MPSQATAPQRGILDASLPRPCVLSLVATGYSALLLAAALLYAARLVRFAQGLRRVLAQPLPPLPDPPPRVSVVVPARNESEHIDACLAALLASKYPPDAFEVVVVDDFSDDDTAARAAATGDPRVRVVRMADRLDNAAASHKGAALAEGIAATTGRLLLTTDADATVDPGWIDAMARMFTSDTVGFVAGWVRMEPGTSVFAKMQALEFAGYVGVGAGALGAGDPNMCNSASMAYPRRVYEALRPVHRRGGSPWDDEMLLHEIAAHPRLTARFCPSAAATVTTHVEPSLPSYFVQKRRWAATGAQYPTPGAAFTARLTWAFNALLLLGLPLLPVLPAGPAWGVALVLKAASEALVLVPTTRHLGLSGLMRWFLPQQAVQIPLTVVLGLATLRGQPAWKGRRFA